ncbi:MAG: hypothetical protein PHZ02_01360 [Desulfocapsaceae bacterium]|nr:hypothetical protein [Desulfocapsaceae bacterium]
MEPDISEFKDFKLVRAMYVSPEIIDQYFGVLAGSPAMKSYVTAIDPATILPIESYTFRDPKSSVYWFNITFVEGRIIITGDCGDNVFVVGGTNEDLKNWLIDLDMDYALGKSKQGREYYDREYAERYIKERLTDDGERTEDEAKAIMEQLDFENHILLQNSMRATNELLKIFPDYWELRLWRWNNYQKMQYKQLVFAGKFLRYRKTTSATGIGGK